MQKAYLKVFWYDTFFCMDSLSQIVLGASVAVIATKAKKHRRLILWAAFFATLPDLDIFFPAINDLEHALLHRTWTHSWVIQSLLAPLAAVLVYKIDKTLSYLRWWFVIWLLWVTHSALDVCTVYGTHLFWPLGGGPLFLGSVFIVDPLYTLPFLLTMVLAFFAKQKNAYRWATLGLVLSTGYLLWAFLAQQWVLQRAVTELKKQNIIYQKIFVGPTYFNSFLWRVVVLKKEKYYEGFGSVFDKNLAIHFKSHDRNLKLLTGLEKNSTIKKMKYFSHGFYAVAPNNKKHTLKVMDLRMGWSNHYYFQYRVAQRESKSKRYKPTAPKRVFFRPQLSEIKTVWNRIWKENNF